MTRTEFYRLLALADEIGADAAFAQLQTEWADEERERDEADYEARDMADRDCDDRRYVYGCGEYDTVDSRGRKLRPTYNEAGEWCGM